MSWIGFDLDGTIARYDGWVDMGVIGEPIPSMIALIRSYLEQGVEVRIVTARAADRIGINAVRNWTEAHIGQALTVTDRKDFEMVVLYDDRVIQVEKNTGVIINNQNTANQLP